MSESEELLNRAGDASTPLEELADLAYRHPETRAAVAGNPSTYPDLLSWLASLGDPDVDAALAARESIPETLEEAQPVEQAEFVEPSPSEAEPSVTSLGASVPLATPGLARILRKPAVLVGLAVVAVVAIAAAAAAIASTRTSQAEAGGSHHSSSSTTEVSAPAPTPHPTPTSVATIAITTNQPQIDDNDLYSIGPLSAVVLPSTAESSTGSTTDGSQLTFKTMLIDPTVAVEASQARWQAPTSQVFGTSAVAAQLDTASPSGFAAVAALTTPSSGLQPASTSYSLAIWSATSSDPTSTAVITPVCPQSCTLDGAWYSGATVVVQWEDSDGHITTGFDAASGTTIWSSAGVDVQDAVGSTLIVADSNQNLAGITMSSGATAWTFAPTGADRGEEYLGYLGGNYIHGDWSSFDGNGYYTHEFVLDTTTGRTVIDRGGLPPNSCLCTYFSNMVYDASSDLVIVEATSPNDSQGRFDIEVVKASDGSAVYTLDSDGLAALGTPPLAAAAGGAAWIQKGNQWDLFVETTGKEDPRAPTVASSPFSPGATNGSISILDRSIAGASLIVAHQGQGLTPDLLAQVTASLK